MLCVRPHGEGVTITPSVGFGAGAAINGHFGIGESIACRPGEYGGLFSQAGGSGEFGTGSYYNRFSNLPFNELSGSRRVEGWTTPGSVGLGAEAGGWNLEYVGDPYRWRKRWVGIIGVRMQLEIA